MTDAISSTSKYSGMDALKKLLLIIASIPMLLCLCIILGLTIGAVSSASATATPSDSVVGENNAILPEQEIIQTSTPVDTPTKSPTKTPAPTATRVPKGLLPGLLPADVTVNLENQGMECGGVEKLQLYYVRTCTKSNSSVLLRVDVYGRQAFSVDLIEASAIQFDSASNSLAEDFLGFVSTMPYDGAMPAEARAWIETSLPLSSVEGVKTTFAGVRFALYGSPEATTLEIGDMP